MIHISPFSLPCLAVPPARVGRVGLSRAGGGALLIRGASTGSSAHAGGCVMGAGAVVAPAALDTPPARLSVFVFEAPLRCQQRTWLRCRANL